MATPCDYTSILVQERNCQPIVASLDLTKRKRNGTQAPKRGDGEVESRRGVKHTPKRAVDRTTVRANDYRLDIYGRRVLMGLTYEETSEFELLEAHLPMYSAELRWLELFEKHDQAVASAASVLS